MFGGGAPPPYGTRDSHQSPHEMDLTRSRLHVRGGEEGVLTHHCVDDMGARCGMGGGGECPTTLQARVERCPLDVVNGLGMR